MESQLANAVPKDEIGAILFDIGNVLIEYDVRRIAAGIAERVVGLTAAEILGSPGSWEVHALAESGALTMEELRDRLNRSFGVRFSEDEWASIWSLGNIRPIARMEELVASLKPAYTLGCLSNIMVWHWEDDRRKIPALALLDHHFLSFELGYRKPEPEIYRLALETLELPGHRVVFIDDTLENVEGARRVGLHGILFRGVPRLVVDLRALGVDRPATGTETAEGSRPQ